MRRPTRSTISYTLFPYTTLFRSGLSVHARRALPRLHRRGPDPRHRVAARRAARRLRAGRRRRHGALDHWRYRERFGRDTPDPYPREADPHGPDDEPRHQHQPAHLSHGASLDRADLHGVSLLAVPAGPAHRFASAEHG